MLLYGAWSTQGATDWGSAWDPWVLPDQQVWKSDMLSTTKREGPMGIPGSRVGAPTRTVPIRNLARDITFR